MAIEYLGLSEVNGPLVVLEGVKNASYEEIVEFTVDGNEKKLGRIVAVYEDKAVIQVFEMCIRDRGAMPTLSMNKKDRASDKKPGKKSPPFAGLQTKGCAAGAAKPPAFEKGGGRHRHPAAVQNIAEYKNILDILPK